MATLDDFLSFLQGASNSAASTVTAPVDAINWALGKAGVPVSKKPVGGSAWLKELGFMAEPKNKNAGLLGEAIGGVLPMVAAAKAPQIAAGLNQAGRNLAAPRTLNPQTGAIVWHGSPHKFDKFDSSKIGTGEGAQAYGHGLYLAEAPDVARAYKDTLSESTLLVGGKPYAGGLLDTQDKAIRSIAAQGYEKSLKAANQMLDDGANPAWMKNYMADLARYKNVPIEWQTGGSLYKVDLPDEHIAKMLDWDKPLSEQHPDVQSVIRNIAPTAKPYDIPIDHDPTGAQFYGMFSAPTEIGQRGASQAFKEAGIPGIRYLDQASRNAGQFKITPPTETVSGKWMVKGTDYNSKGMHFDTEAEALAKLKEMNSGATSNFVVFPGNEGLLSILERNGQALK